MLACSLVPEYTARSPSWITTVTNAQCLSVLMSPFLSPSPMAPFSTTATRGSASVAVEVARELRTVARPDDATSDTVAAVVIDGAVIEMCTSLSSLSCVDSWVVASEATRMGLSRVEPSSCDSACGSSSTRIGLSREPNAERSGRWSKAGMLAGAPSSPFAVLMVGCNGP